ncbi:MAG: lamin tail domain-containing protein [Acidimicrobiia bacterium]|nr:lamin tail domain-containing protein [Acidimicrobiia bacterium]
MIPKAAAMLAVILLSACVGITTEVDLPIPTPADPAGGSIEDLDLDLVDVEIVRVLDGDSVLAIIDGIETDVRLQGINAPERDECLGDESRRRLEQLLHGGPVQIAGTEFDQFDRLLGIITAGGVATNVTLVADGLAIPLAAESPIDQLVLEAEERARTLAIGIWDPLSCGSGPIPDVAVVSVDSNPPGRDEDALDGERVVIRNRSDSPVDLTGWTLRDESTLNRFAFPDGTVLPSGEELEIVVGCEPAADRVTWCNDRPVWNNGGDTALLLDADGRIVDLYRYRDEG